LDLLPQLPVFLQQGNDLFAGLGQGLEGGLHQ
jgi:hypothetical protein